MNFISTFDELNKLYESDQQSKSDKKLAEYYDEEAPLGRGERYPETKVKPWANNAPQWWKDQGGTEASWKQAQRDNREMNNWRNPWESLDDENADSEKLAEATEDEISTEESPVEELVIEEEPRQIICECDKCGALVIKDEAEIVVDEETDLVNVEEECKFCEEAKGFKIIGTVAPYEPIIEEESVEEVVEESLNNSELLKEIEKTNELKTEHESEYLTLNEGADDIIDEDLADIYRKTFDKPASTKTQQKWEDELNGEMGEISDKRRAHLEKKFAQQRDWEARHEADAE